MKLNFEKQTLNLFEELSKDGASLESISIEDKTYLMKAPQDVKSAALAIISSKKKDFAAEIIDCARKHMRYCSNNNRPPSSGVIYLAWNIIQAQTESANIQLANKESFIQTKITGNLPLDYVPPVTISEQ